jgi:DNA-binding FadR family transcriptional regulator
LIRNKPRARKTGFIPKAVRPRRAGDEVANQLREALVNGVLKPGDRLEAEPTLAEQFGVSRPTIRNAINTLRKQGMLRTVRGAKGGHFVVVPQTDIVMRDIGETFSLWFDAGAVTVSEVDEARVVVERQCVRLAALRRTEEDLEALREIVERPADERAPLEEFWDADIRFHQQIARAARNRLLELPMMAIHLLRPYTNRLMDHHDRTRTRAQHLAIYEGIAARDPDRAEQALIAHVESLARQRKREGRTHLH